jgi:hypothetical protein
MMVAKVLAEGKRLRLGFGDSRGHHREVSSLSADRQVKDAGVQSCEPTCLPAGRVNAAVV